MPRRARQLIPQGLPRRTEVLAACAVAILIAHLLLAQLTLVLAVIFAVIGKTSRWRTWWLLAPAGAGLAWTLAAGPGNAVAGFTAGPSGILWHLAGGHLAGQARHPLAGFSGVQGWLPRQFPVALICGSAEAALVGWLDWLHTDEWAVPPPRPGLVAAVRRGVAARAIRAGAVVTREGCALGVASATGAVAELRWVEGSRGTLIAGAAVSDVTLAGLQMVHAALRRRKPVIVLDPGDAAITRAVRTACLATGVPLLTNGHSDLVEPAGADVGTASPSQLWGRGASQEPRSREPRSREPQSREHRAEGQGFPAGAARPSVDLDLGRVVRERSAVLLPAGSPELGAGACADLAALAGELRRIGVDGDALVWAPRGEMLTGQTVAPLLRDGPEAGLSVLIAATSPAAAAEFAGLVGATLSYRVTDRDLALTLASRTGTRLLPASAAAALADISPDNCPPSSAPGPGTPVAPGGPVPLSAGSDAGRSVTPGANGLLAAGLVPSPVIPARTLLTLGQAEFILAVGWPRQRLIAPGRMVPARLPHAAGQQGSRA